MHRVSLTYNLVGVEPAQRDLHHPLLALLAAVHDCGSINGAARRLGLSYRHVWGELKRWEQELGQTLVVWNKGRPAVLSTFRLTNSSLDGDHNFPALTVFGSIKVTAVSVFQGTDADGSSYTVKPEGLTLAQVAKAADLKKNGNRYVRKVRDGVIEASEPRAGQVQLACIREGGQQ